MGGTPQERLARKHEQARAERRRVRDLLARDRADREAERARREAEKMVENGAPQYANDAAVRPTREWHQQGDSVLFTAALEDGTVNAAKSVRRVQNSYVRRLFRSNRITEEQYRACIWYRVMHEAAGLEARYKSATLGGIGGGETAFGVMARTAAEADARRAFREAAEAIGSQVLSVFNKVVLGDQPILAGASRVSKDQRKRSLNRFCQMCDRLVVHIQAQDSDMFDRIKVERDG